MIALLPLVERADADADPDPMRDCHDPENESLTFGY